MPVKSIDAAARMPAGLLLVWLLTVGGLTYNTALADGRLAGDAGEVLNVQLQGGVLKGLAAADAAVRLTTPTGDVHATLADAEGRFRFTGLSAGLVRVETAHAGRVLRLWDAAAPPSAAEAVRLITADAAVDSATVVRGQSSPAGTVVCCEPTVWDRCRAAGGSAKWFVLAGIGAVAIIELAEDEPAASP